MARPAIPAEIKRAVLVESGHRCAVPRCGETELDIHHIIPWETCQKHEYANLIALCVICHRRAHKGDIDKKSLLQYKAALASSSSPIFQVGFDSPAVEIRRRISETVDGTDRTPGYKFEFDFPDFPTPTQKIVSKNLEAWGNELLSKFRSDNDFTDHFHNGAVLDEELSAFFSIPHRLKGVYRVVRNDPTIISLEYKIHSYYSGAAHGGITTRVQNFFVNPFSPITITDLLDTGKTLEDFSNFIRSALRSTGYYDESWMLGGTEPIEENFSRFLIGNYGVEFIFEEYQIASYAEGRQILPINYYDLREIFNPELIKKLEDHDNYDY